MGFFVCVSVLSTGDNIKKRWLTIIHCHCHHYWHILLFISSIISIGLINDELYKHSKIFTILVLYLQNGWEVRLGPYFPKISRWEFGLFYVSKVEVNLTSVYPSELNEKLITQITSFTLFSLLLKDFFFFCWRCFHTCD